MEIIMKRHTVATLAFVFARAAAPAANAQLRHDDKPHGQLFQAAQ